MNEIEKEHYSKFMVDHLPWFEEIARQHAIKEAGGLPGYSFDDFCDLPNPPEVVAIETERAYRRGYWQGYGKAMSDLERGCNMKLWMKVAEWFETKLSAWRLSPKPKLLAEPPQF